MMTMLTSPAMTPAKNEQTSQQTHERRKLLTVLGSGLSGTTIEFYDFFIYGTAAALVFPSLFFPNLSPLMALLVSFLTLSITFVSRPIGAIVFGHYGDKIGRKKSLVLSLMIMGISTFFIGLIPSYDTIGNAARHFCSVGQRAWLVYRHRRFCAGGDAAGGGPDVMGLARAFPVKHRAAVRRDVYPLKDRRDAGVSGESETAAERAESGGAEVSYSHRAQTSP